MKIQIESPIASDRHRFATSLMYVGLVVFLVVERMVPANLVLPIGISIRVSQLILMLLGLAVVLALAVDVRPGPRGVVGALGVLTVVVLLVAPFISAPGMTSFETDGAQRGIVELILLTVLFVAAYQVSVRDTQRAHSLLVLVVALTAIQVAVAVYESTSGFYVVEQWDFLRLGFLEDDPDFNIFLGLDVERIGGSRPTATAPHPIVMSSLVGLSILLVLAKYPELKGGRTRGVAVAAIGLMVIGLFVLHTRTGFAILLVGGLVAIFLVVRHSADHVIRFALAGLGTLAAAVILVPGSARTMLNLFGRAPGDSSVTSRVADYALIPDMLAKRPYVGAGFMTRDPNDLFIDNSYLDGLVEFGLVGGLIVLAFLITVTARPFRAFADAQPAERTLLAAGAVSGIALLVGMALFDALKFAQFLPVVLVMMAVGVGTADEVLRRRDRDPARRNTRDSRQTRAPVR